jgi:hypothetical protein
MRLSGEEGYPWLLQTVCAVLREDHGHHLQNEKAVIANVFTLRLAVNSVNAFRFDELKSKEDGLPLT